jgi:hypothetical protein
MDWSLVKKIKLIPKNLPWLGKGTLTLIEGFDILKRNPKPYLKVSTNF